MKTFSCCSAVVCLSVASVFFTFTGDASAEPDKVLYAFQGSDGWGPSAVIADKTGALYGTTQYGGTGTGCSSGCGTVFKLTPPATQGGAWTESVLYNFMGDTDGFYPQGSLLLVGDALYGTAGGGTAGLVFELTPPAGGGNGPWTEAVIYNFEGGTDGINPVTGLTLNNEGIYGTTEGGGEFGFGTVFQLTRKASVWSESVLYSFQGTTDGAFPSSVVFDSTGSLYGAASQGGDQNCYPDGDSAPGCGTIFQLTPPVVQGAPWTLTVLYSFQSGGDGCFPLAPVLGSAGELYGTTFSDGNSPCTNPENSGHGVAFELTPSSGASTWTETVLYTFGPKSGVYPRAGVTIDSAGNLYGTTQGDGGRTGHGYGTAFKLSPAVQGGHWTESTLHVFGGTGDGASSEASLLLRKGQLFGTTSGGGAGYGTVFELAP